MSGLTVDRQRKLLRTMSATPLAQDERKRMRVLERRNKALYQANQVQRERILDLHDVLQQKDAQIATLDAATQRAAEKMFRRRQRAAILQNEINTAALTCELMATRLKSLEVDEDSSE